MANDTTLWAPLAAWLLDEIGYAIPEHKYYLLNNNMTPIMTAHGLPRVHDLIGAARLNPKIRQDVINAATINESFFFRDTSVWHALGTRILPKLAEEVSFQKQINILVCACSRGQEVYTIKMIAEENKQTLNNTRCVITATDIDTGVLAQAKSGQYTKLEAERGLDPALRQRYFSPINNNPNDGYTINPILKQNLSFQQLNLNEKFSFPHRFDLIFCRNVLIYFDVANKKKIVEQLAGYLNNHGYLMLGGAESLIGVTDIMSSRLIDNCLVHQKKY